MLKNEVDATLSRWLVPRLRMLSACWKRRVCWGRLCVFSAVAGAIVGVHQFLVGPTPSRAARVNTLVERQLNDAWRMYVKRFVSPQGRVIDDANGDISHSEGQGYAMLIAARLKDRVTFDRLWAWSRANLFVRSDHLPAWVWDPQTDPHVRDIDDASDGNILIAWALFEAGKQWAVDDYLSVARKMAESVARLDTEPSRYGLVLLPGSRGFRLRDRPADGPIVNLSYWVFPAFRHLKHATSAVDWKQITASGLSVIADARFGSDKMPTDWISLADVKAAAARGFPSVFGYDAIRIPLYLAWGRPNDRSALEVFAPLLTSARIRSPSVIDLRTGKAQEPFKENGYRSIPMLLKCALYGTSFSRAFYDVQPELYYPTTLHILALLAAQDSYPSCLRG